MPCDLAALLNFAKQEGASDLHISTGNPPILRLRGSIVRLDTPPLTAQETHDAIRTILTEDHRRIFDERH